MTNIRARIQSFGGFLTNMVLPNIGAFIAWGILTALFIPTGWFPNEYLGKMVGPIITYLLPLLLAHTGGYMISGQRGAVMGCIGTVGLIIGSDIPMFLGAMIVGPLGGWIIKKWDDFIQKHIPTGFEMVINNFSIGILGFGLLILSYVIVGPAIQEANTFITRAIEALVATGFLPLLSIINEPAKVLFLNNVIDQGIYYPLGLIQTADLGKSIYFMVASNPGPGLGLLLAFMVFGSKMVKSQASGAAIIHFFGGIHELYYPFVFMRPLTIFAMILGGMSGTFIFQMTGVGLVAGPSPGSIFSYLALTPKGSFLGVILGVTVSTIVSFLVTSVILKAQGVDKEEMEEDQDLSSYVDKVQEMKSEGKQLLEGNKVQNIAFACDAGMGSSAMGASAFKKRLEKEGITDLIVKHYRIEDITVDADVIVVHESLSGRVLLNYKDKKIITLKNYMSDKNLDILLEEIIKTKK